MKLVLLVIRSTQPNEGLLAVIDTAVAGRIRGWSLQQQRCDTATGATTARRRGAWCLSKPRLLTFVLPAYA